jgi:hypothetical protein
MLAYQEYLAPAVVGVSVCLLGYMLKCDTSVDQKMLDLTSKTFKERFPREETVWNKMARYQRAEEERRGVEPSLLRRIFG